jgi:hypothetical protein
MALPLISKKPLFKENTDKNTHKQKQINNQTNNSIFNPVHFITRNNTYQDPF